MHNTYITSSISLRTKCSLSSLSFNDHSSYLRNESFHKNPLLLCQSSSCCNCCSCCCCCCDFTRRVPVNPSLLLYGLRQSTLVQLKPSRRFMLGGGDLCYDRVPVGRVGRDSYGVSCNVKEKGIVDGIRRMGRDRFGSKYLNERSKRRCSVGEIEAEVMLSLLTEDMDDECCDLYEIVQVKKRENACDQSYIKKEKNVQSGYLKSNSKFEFESDRIKTREQRSKRKVKNERFYRDENQITRNEGSTSKFEFESDRNKSRDERSKRKVKNERSSRDENRITKTEGSNCSTYYTCASDDELERKMEVKHNEEEHMVDSSIVSSSNMKRFGKGRTEAEHVEQLYTQIDDNQDQEEVAKQESTVVGSYVGRSNVDWDLRKKSEKKLSEEVFVDKNEKLILAGNSSLEINKRVSHQDIGESTSTNYRHDTVAINQEDKRHSSQKIYSTDAHMTSSSQKQFHDREKNARASVNLVQQKRDDTRIDVVNTSISQRQSETRLKKQDKTSTSIQSSVEEIKQAGFRRSSQEINDESYRYDENKSTSRWKSEDMLKNREESSQILSSSRPEETLQHVHTGSGGGWRSEQRKESLNVTSSTSVVHVSDTEKVTSSTIGSKSRMGNKESYITSSDGYDKIDGRRMQIGLSKEAQRPIRASGFHGSTSNEVSQSRLQQARAQDHDNRSSHAMLMPPPLQLVAIEEAPKDKSESGSSSIYVYPQEEGTAAHNQVLIAHEDALGSADRHQKSSMHFVGDFVEKIRHEVPKATSESGSSFTSTYVNPQEDGSASHDQVYGGGRRSGTYEEAVNFSGHEDALGSADRLQKSSTHFVGDFVENIRHEVSTSDIIYQQLVSETKLKDKNAKQMQELDSRPSSGASELKAPSDEKWDVPETSVQEYQITETTHTPAEGSASTRSTIAKRNSKSLWNVVADIIQFKWGASHSQKHTSRAKSSVRSSSNESVTSEAWFSGRDPDSSDQSERVKATLINQKGPELVKGEDETSPITDDKSTSSSLGVLKTGSTSFGKISVSHEENLSSSGNGARNEDNPSSSLLVQSSLPSSFRQLRRSPVVDGSFSVTGKDEESASGVMEQQELSQSTKDGELKRRKLQRNSQLPKDRFDEWEEAYMHETELRKMDEMYMQEALIEARKAADTWEVPVGAVLVQHGKIIARGFNLVEELRDSTAHAEMICIREASNVLKTWRLSETTLYVTLEPCPMCAGAILQARVDTVVWGAPNKLLGADGSWIRLFPNGGGNGSELSDKPAPPVHPFHPNMKVRRGVLATECADIMQQFFQLRRKKKDKSPETPTTLSRLHISHHPSKIIGKMHGLFNVMFCL